MKFFQSRKFKIIGTTALIAVLLTIAFIFIQDKKELRDNHKFTVGTPIRYDVNSNTGNDMVYVYTIDNVRYSQSFPCSDFHGGCRTLINKHFYVMFNPDNPQNSELLLDFPVPDSITKAPTEGWNKIPNIPDWQQPKSE